jgi:hypothetical protein
MVASESSEQDSCLVDEIGVEVVVVEAGGGCVPGGVRQVDVGDVDHRLEPETTSLTRTTTRYDRARVSLDRHATYIVAAFVAGASR